MVAITTRAGKGSPLTHTEVDSNFNNLKTAVEAGQGVTVYATIDDLPLSSLTAGDLAYVSATNRLYITNGTGWYNIALVNQTPTISGNSAVYTLSTTGVATVVTLTATDPEGIPITWTYTASGDTGAATISQADNVFTITPSTNVADAGTLTITFKASDGINIGTAESDFQLLFTSPYWANLITGIQTSTTNNLGNDVYIDRSSNTASITTTGDVQQTSFHPYRKYWSAWFDGSNDVFKILSTGNYLNWGTGDFTIEAWIKPDGTDYFSVWQNTDIVGSAGSGEYFFGVSTTGNASFGRHAGYGSIAATGGEVTNNEWNHIAVCRDSTSLRLYVNGSRVAEQSSGSPFDYNFGNSGDNRTHTVGYRVTPNYGGGYIADLRAVKGTAVYTGASYTTPSDKLTAVTGTGFLFNSNRFVDTSGNNLEITTSSEPKIRAESPFGEDDEFASASNKGSAFFGGSGKIDVLSATDLGTGDFTFQMWVYSRNLSGTKQIISNRQDGGSIYIGTNGTEFYPYVGGSYQTSNAKLITYSWNHFAFVRSGTSVYTYVNGTRFRTDTNAGDLFGTQGYSIGSADVGVMDGFIADLKVSNTAEYTGSTYTVPTSPVGNTNAELYLPMDNQGVFDKTDQRVWLSGNAVSSTAQTKFATTSLKCAAASDYAVIPNISFGAVEKFTIEGWFRFDSASGNVYIMGHNTTYVNNNNMYQMGLASGVLGWWFGGSVPTNQRDTVALSADTWYHIAWVRDGTSFKVFKDGTECISFTSSTSFNNYGWIVGNSFDGATQGFTGYIENFQILEGVAKYATNFTAPTQTQGKDLQTED